MGETVFWEDVQEDMDPLALVRRILDQEANPATLAKVDKLNNNALDPSQRNQFELPRHHHVTALEIVRPDLAPREF